MRRGLDRGPNQGPAEHHGLLAKCIVRPARRESERSVSRWVWKRHLQSVAHAWRRDVLRRTRRGKPDKVVQRHDRHFRSCYQRRRRIAKRFYRLFFGPQGQLQWRWRTGERLAPTV